MKRNASQILAELSREVGRGVLDVLGEDNVLSVFLTGSVAGEEAACYTDGAFHEIYSDLDIAVVVSDGVDLERSRCSMRRLAADFDLEGPDHRMFARPDIGAFSLDDLHSQRARPGTVGIARSHRVIFGSKDVPRDLEVLSTASIDPEEALYLLEHRLLESHEVAEYEHGSVANAPWRRYAHYVTLKSCLDAMSAVLIVCGRYVPSRDERARVFSNDELRPCVEGLLPEDALGTVQECARQMQNLQETLAGDPSSFAPARGDAERLLLRLWKRIDDRTSGSPGERWYDAIRRRTTGSTTRGHLRDLMVLARRRSLSRARLALRARQLARFSPVDMLRLTGLVESVLSQIGDEVKDEPIEKDFVAALEGLTREFGFRSGSIFQRGRAMYRAIT